MTFPACMLFAKGQSLKPRFFMSIRIYLRVKNIMVCLMAKAKIPQMSSKQYVSLLAKTTFTSNKTFFTLWEFKSLPWKITVLYR